MTAEIALLNRRALAFAADSAVTISDGKSDKIYNSAEKIFQLSHATPLGLMIYNSMEFAGVPIDVMVRRFRAEIDQEFESCHQACDKFVEYLSSFPRENGDENTHLYSVVASEFAEVNKEFTVGATDYILTWMENHKGENIDFSEVNKKFAISILDEHIRTHADRPLGNYLDDKGQSDFDLRYGEVVRLIIPHCAKDLPFSIEIESKFLELAFAAIKSRVFSDGRTGIIIGGFGHRDTFPALYSIEIDGIFFDRVKSRETFDVKIDRSRERAAIIPFAQSEMVERFLFGVDSSLEETLLQFIRKTSKDAETALLQSGADISKLKVTAEDYAQSVQGLLSLLKAKSKKETLDMVDFMPKQEMAYAAEAFISLTSVKRKVSAQQETVGGPIDVAMITKNEGFVWIKRKHYFDLELNPLYSSLHRKPPGRTP